MNVFLLIFIIQLDNRTHNQQITSNTKTLMHKGLIISTKYDADKVHYRHKF